MWVRFRNILVDVVGVVIESSTSTIWVIPVSADGKLKVGAYVNPERAKEVFDEFMTALKAGKAVYEFPDA